MVTPWNSSANSFCTRQRTVSPTRQKFALLISKGNFSDLQFARFQRLSASIGRFLPARRHPGGACACQKTPSRQHLSREPAAAPVVRPRRCRERLRSVRNQGNGGFETRDQVNLTRATCPKYASLGPNLTLALSRLSDINPDETALPSHVLVSLRYTSTDMVCRLAGTVTTEIG